MVTSSEHPLLPQTSQPATQAQANDIANIPFLTCIHQLEEMQQLTPRPEGGFPSPQLGAPTMFNIEQRTRMLWEAKAMAKAWVCPYWAYFEMNLEESKSKIYVLITKLIGRVEAQSLILRSPSQEFPYLNNKYPPPWHFLLSGSSQAATDFLTGWEIASTKETSAIFIPYHQPLLNYICSLEKFSLPDSPESNAKVTAIIQQALHGSLDAMDLKRKGAAPIIVDQITALFYITSLCLAISPTKMQTVWNIYCRNPPTVALDTFFC
ncbi:hypothetical protein ID866_9870 [Astraeus odoratus]|nr:hypothetical protein ID866_9870 [Astraeus odoratus]